MTTGIASRLKTAGAISASLLVLLFPLVGSQAAAAGSPATQQNLAPQASQLLETGPNQQRWLSVPQSRLILNPYNFSSSLSPVQQANGPDLPLASAYYANGTPVSSSPLLGLYQKPAGTPPPVQVQYNDTFATSTDLSGWQANETGISATSISGELQLEIGSNAAYPYGWIQHTTTVNVTKTTTVQITIPKTVGLWVLKVNNGHLATDIPLSPNGGSSQTGTFSFNLQKATGWSGSTPVVLKIFAVGKNQPVYVSDIQVVTPPQFLTGTSSFSTQWLPYALPFAGTYPDGLQVRGEDSFYSKSSVDRQLTFSNIPSSGAQELLFGAYDGQVAWNSSRHLLTIQGPKSDTAIVLPTAQAPQYFSSSVMLAADSPVSGTPPTSGVWAIPINLQPAHGSTQTFTTSVGFAVRPNAMAKAVQRATTASASHAPNGGTSRWQRYYNHLLASVPAPQNFSLSSVPANGVTAAAIRQMYYTAWVFLASDVLPAMPEIGYNYPQLATGKPSLLNDGLPGAVASASWDSMFAIQLEAYIHPNIAWQAFQGIMTIVRPSGRLPGESLPSREAQTAWDLYALTGNKQALQSIYPALSRLLLWQAKNPRWIYLPGGYNYPGEQDAEFVAELLVGQQYMEKIATALNISNGAQYWAQQRSALMSDYEKTFWSNTQTSDSSPKPVEQYFPTDPTCKPSGGCLGSNLWTAEGLHVAGLPSSYVAGLVDRFNMGYSANASLAGFNRGSMKYPALSYVDLGLLDHGMITQAQVLTNSIIRDITSTNTFSEVYKGTPPQAAGVRPDVMGAAALINMVWLANGYQRNGGVPRFVLMPGETGGLQDLKVLGRSLSVAINANSNRVLLSGSLIRGHRCSVSAPIGQTIGIPSACATQQP